MISLTFKRLGIGEVTAIFWTMYVPPALQGLNLSINPCPLILFESELVKLS